MNYQPKHKRVYSTAELARHVGDVTHAASDAPVVITHHNKPRYVLMSLKDFERMNPQKSYAVDNMPENLRDDLIKALDDFLSGKSGYDD
jgi:prevent-host-death family protein